MLRSIAAVLVGLLAGVVVIVSLEQVSSRLYPAPPGVTMLDPVAFAEHVRNLPLGAFLLVLASWGIGSLLGSWIATRLSAGGHLAHGTVVGALFLASAIANLLAFPHPVWFWVVAPATIAAATWLGIRAGRRGRARGDLRATARA